MSDWGNFYSPPPASMAPPPPPPPPPPPVDYALPAGIAYAPSTGVQDAYASGQQTTAFNAGQQGVRNYGQDVFSSVTAPLTQDPARYAAIGAEYGRATGGFGSAPAGGGGSVFDTGTSAIPYTSGPFMSAYGGGIGTSIPSFGSVAGGLVGPSGSGGAAATLPNQGYVTGGGSAQAGYTPPPPPPPPSAGIPYTGGPFQSAEVGGGIGAATPRVPYGGRDAITAALMNQGGTSFADRFSAAPPITGGLQPALGPQLPPEIMTGFPEPAAPPASPTPPPSVADLPRNFGSTFGSLPEFDENSFANRFGAGGYFQPGTPSQYYTGSQYGGPSALPPGYSPPFSVDNPQGALPGAPFTPPSPVTEGPGFQPSPDTLSPSDLNIPFRPPIMGMGDDEGATFGERFGDWPTNMANFQSPANDYGTFQQGTGGATPVAPPVTGTASTYDPTAELGTMGLASGGTYDPNAFSTAIQTSLRDRFGGVKYGQPPTQGVVQSPGGQQAVVDVNDVGPLTQNRVMDLSTAAMRYFNPSATPNSGLLPNMQITPLPSGATYPTGPVGPIGPTGPMLPTPGIPAPNLGPVPPYTPTTGFIRR